jgi:DNA-binding winged helix-turn-helix (wHTH) protein
MQIWLGLDAQEQRALDGRAPPSGSLAAALRELGLLTSGGRLFSSFFEACVPALMAQHSPRGAIGVLVDQQARRFYLDGQEITARLTEQQICILLCLHKRVDRVCTFEELYNECWAVVPVEGKLGRLDKEPVHRAIARLRTIIGGDKYLTSVRGQGYSLRGPSGYQAVFC